MDDALTDEKLERIYRIEYLVTRYQQGDNDVILELLDYFEIMIKKYYKLLQYGTIYHDTKSNKKIYKILSSEIEPIIASNKLKYIAMVYGAQPKEYIMSDLQFILLKMAKRYESNDRTFLHI